MFKYRKCCLCVAETLLKCRLGSRSDLDVSPHRRRKTSIWANSSLGKTSLLLGYSQAAKARDFDSRIVGSNPTTPAIDSLERQTLPPLPSSSIPLSLDGSERRADSPERRAFTWKRTQCWQRGRFAKPLGRSNAASGVGTHRFRHGPYLSEWFQNKIHAVIKRCHYAKIRNTTISLEVGWTTFG